MNWNIKSFEELSNIELYEILKIRNEVFIIEQNCHYLDLDDKDYKSFHIFVKKKLIRKFLLMLGLFHQVSPIPKRVLDVWLPRFHIEKTN